MDYLFFGLWVLFGLGFAGVVIAFLIRLLMKRKPRWWIYVPTGAVLFIGVIVSMIGFGSQPEVQKLAAEKESQKLVDKIESSKPSTPTSEDSESAKETTSKKMDESTEDKPAPEEKKDTEPTKSVAKEAPKKETKKPITIEEKATASAHEIFGDEKDPVDQSVKGVEYDDDDKSLMITVQGKDGWSDKSIGLGFYEDSTALYRALSEEKQISEIWISILFPMKDTYGKVEDEEVMGTWMSRETMDRIEWKSFDYQNLLDVVDGKSIYPQFVQ